MAEIGPKEAAQRANGEANKKRRKLIPYAGKDNTVPDAVSAFNYKGPTGKPPAAKRKYRKGPR